MVNLDEAVTPEDSVILNHQLGREARGVQAISARCACGVPLVVTTSPRLPDGSPFPTLYYLTHPGLTAAISRIEASGAMNVMTERLSNDPDLAASYLRAHNSYIQDRQRITAEIGIPDVLEIAGISAGGMPARVKCLHALVAHTLATNPGVNPFGDEALAAIGYNPADCICAALP